MTSSVDAFLFVCFFVIFGIKNSVLFAVMLYSIQHIRVFEFSVFTYVLMVIGFRFCFIFFCFGLMVAVNQSGHQSAV